MLCKECGAAAMAATAQRSLTRNDTPILDTMHGTVETAPLQWHPACVMPAAGLGSCTHPYSCWQAHTPGWGAAVSQCVCLRIVRIMPALMAPAHMAPATCCCSATIMFATCMLAPHCMPCRLRDAVASNACGAVPRLLAVHDHCRSGAAGRRMACPCPPPRCHVPACSHPMRLPAVQAAA